MTGDVGNRLGHPRPATRTLQAPWLGLDSSPGLLVMALLAPGRLSFPAGPTARALPQPTWGVGLGVLRAEHSVTEPQSPHLNPPVCCRRGGAAGRGRQRPRDGAGRGRARGPEGGRSGGRSGARARSGSRGRAAAQVGPWLSGTSRGRALRRVLLALASVLELRQIGSMWRL